MFALRRALTRASKAPFARAFVSTSTRVVLPRRALNKRIVWAASVAFAGFALASTHKVHLDAGVNDGGDETVVDPDTSISFPKVLTIPSKLKLEPVSFVGVGVRTVSFLGIKVYSVAFYADLNNPNLKIPLHMAPEDKIRHIVQNTSCVIRIVPTRSTSYTHLRDAFMRMLNARLIEQAKAGTISEETATNAASPLRKLKSVFPNSTLNKHTPMDVYLTPPSPNRPRALVIRDLGSIENDWVATELVLSYFGETGPSPPLKKTVFDNLRAFQK